MKDVSKMFNSTKCHVQSANQRWKANVGKGWYFRVNHWKVLFCISRCHKRQIVVCSQAATKKHIPPTLINRWESSASAFMHSMHCMELFFLSVFVLMVSLQFILLSDSISFLFFMSCRVEEISSLFLALIQLISYFFFSPCSSLLWLLLFEIQYL